MKKCFKLSLVLFTILCGCSSSINNDINSTTTENSSSYNVLERMEYFKTKYPLYVEITNKDRPNCIGTRDIYCWQNEDNEWYSGIHHYEKFWTNTEPFLKIQYEYPCPLKEMAELLNLFFDITDPYLAIFDLQYPYAGDYSISMMPSTNKYLYDQLNLRASYIYNVLREEK